MAMQTQMSSFAQKYGNRVAAANEQCKDAPVDTGFQSLPAGIKNGVARLQVMTIKVQDKEDKKIPKGELYFSAAAVVVSPTHHNNMKVAGMQTFKTVGLCDIPAKGMRKAKPFEENYAEMQNIIRMFGVAPCPETKATDPTGQKTEAYWKAAMVMLCDPARPPKYVSFSTREWTPPKTAQQPNPQPMTQEEWHGECQWNVVTNPAAGVTVNGSTQPMPSDTPPGGHTNGAAVTQVATQAQSQEQFESFHLAEEVEILVAEASKDPSGETPEGKAAGKRLEELAWKNGWSEEQTKNADSWADVGQMALSAATEETATPVPTVGSTWKFRKRDQHGSPLKGRDGNELPALDVVVATVDENAKTCTLRTVSDGKDLTEFRSKKPLTVKWEHLEG